MGHRTSKHVLFDFCFFFLPTMNSSRVAAAGGAQNEAQQQGPTFSCTFVNAEFFASLVAILREFVDVLGEPKNPTFAFFSFRRDFTQHVFRLELMIVREGIKIKMMDCKKFHNIVRRF